MRFKLALLAPVVCLTVSSGAPRALAQESLAGVGAASAMGATLGASAAGGLSTSRATRGVGGGATGNIPEGVDPSFPTPGAVSTTTTSQTEVTRTTPVVPLAGVSGGGIGIMRQLLTPTFQPIPVKKKLSPRGQANYANRVAKLSPKGRKRLALQKYRIAPRGYLASYLPQDRYKFSKAWKYVSTETDRFYYSPQAMAQRRFNPNQVIGFRTWQDAMLAGYRPDPASKPAPANDIYLLSFAGISPQLGTYAEYAYAGQINPNTHERNMSYVKSVIGAVYEKPYLRSQVPYVTAQALGSVLGLNEPPKIAATQGYWVKLGKQQAEQSAKEEAEWRKFQEEVREESRREDRARALLLLAALASL